MESKLRIKTKSKKYDQSEEVEEELEAVSPTTEFFLAESATLYNLGIFQLEVLVHLAFIYSWLQNDFLNVHPRLSSIPVEDQKGNKKWKRVEVNIKDHVKVPNFAEGLSTEDYSKQFDKYISKIATSKIALDKPLWELHIFNYPTKNSTSTTSSKSNVATFIVKLHHAIADGTSLMAVVFSCFKRVDDPSIPLAFPSSRSRKTAITSKQQQQQHNYDVVKNMINVFNIVPKFFVSIFHSFYDFGQSIRLLCSQDDPSPIRSGNSDLPLYYKVSTVILSLTDVKRIKAILGVTVNDVIVGILFVGIRLYMREMNNGQKMKTQSTMMIVLNIRKDKGYALPEEMRKDNTKVPWGNRVSSIEIPITNLDDEDFKNPIECIMNAHKLILRKRNTPFAHLLLDGFIGIVRTFGGLEAAAGVFQQKMKNSSFLLTNIIGPTEKMSVAGHPVNGFYFIPTGLKSSLTVSVMSYTEVLTIGLAVKEGFIDHQRLSICLEKAFHSIFEAATSSI